MPAEMHKGSRTFAEQLVAICIGPGGDIREASPTSVLLLNFIRFRELRRLIFTLAPLPEAVA